MTFLVEKKQWKKTKKYLEKGLTNEEKAIIILNRGDT